MAVIQALHTRLSIKIDMLLVLKVNQMLAPKEPPQEKKAREVIRPKYVQTHIECGIILTGLPLWQILAGAYRAPDIEHSNDNSDSNSM